MSDRDDTHEDAINGEADLQGTEGLDGAQSGDDLERFDDELDSETAALLGAALRPVDPPTASRSPASSSAVWSVWSARSV